MDKNAKVSIIVPVYNAQDSLERSVESLIAQTYKRIEIILVDDGSTDDSSKICDMLLGSDNRIKVIHIENQGVSVARNIGLEKTTGKYVIFLDADDIQVEETVELAMKEVLENKCDTVCWNVIEKKGGTQEYCPPILPMQYKLEKERINILISALLYTQSEKNYCGKRFRAVWGKLLCTEVIKKNNIKFPIGIPLGEDAIFLIEYFKNCDSVIFVNEYWNIYNISSESAVGRYRPNILEVQRQEYKLLKEALGSIKADIDYNTTMVNVILQAERQFISNELKNNKPIFYLPMSTYNYIVNRGFHIPSNYNIKRIKKVDRIRVWLINKRLFYLEVLIDMLIGIKHREKLLNKM